MSDDREGKNWCVLLSGGERKGRYRPILFKKNVLLSNGKNKDLLNDSFKYTNS
jgi:hypothetical protein